jgi:hypothetical protein
MNPPDRTHLYAWTTLYAALTLGWTAFAQWVVPPLLLSNRPGPLIEAMKRQLEVPPMPFFGRTQLDRWQEFTVAVVIALALQLTIVVILNRYDRRSAEAGSPPDFRSERRTSLALGIIALVFLAVTILSGVRQDHFFYLEIWYHVLHGHDPWFRVSGINGFEPLNAYGPLFNPLAGLSWLNPLAPKLLFSYTYILFSISWIKRFAAGRPPSELRTFGLIALFWNPFSWVEVALFGHFDVLVALACLGAVRQRARGHDIRSGAYLAAGVLLKYLPTVLLPFLAIDRGRFRSRFLFVALAAIASGLAVSFHVWGLSTFSPLSLAATRASTTSIFHFLRGRYSPFPWWEVRTSVDSLAPVVQLLALVGAWRWSRYRKLDVEASAVVAVVITVLLYRVGYPQYQMVPFVLGTSWLIGHWDRLRNRRALVVATTCYFGWLAAFDVYYYRADFWNINLDGTGVREMVGLPTFLLGCSYLASLIASAPVAPDYLEK